MRGFLLTLFSCIGLASAGPVDIPFRLSGGMILVSVTMHGAARSMDFILDSGAGGTVLAKHVATELDLTLTGRERVRTVNGVETVSRAADARLFLGDSSRPLRFSSAPLVMDLTRESRSLGTRIDGLLGADFFDGRSIKIDFKSSRLRLSPSERPGQGAIQLPLSGGRGGMFVGITADDHSLPRVRLDTGCRRSLCWTPTGGSALPVFWRDGKTMKVDVNLGSLIVSAVPSDVYRRPLFAGEDGLLGTGLLSRFDSVWIDSVNQWVAFERLRN